MSCCKAEKYYWCKHLPGVYIDDEGKKYCVFHAPQGKKGISVNEFNKLIFKKIYEAKGSKPECILDGTVFEGGISFRQFNKNNPLPEISFYEATFTEKTDFCFTTFGERVNFFEAIFSKEANFFKTIFSKEANFPLTKFSKEADFSLATFSEEAYFGYAKFSEKANFRNLNIAEEIKFEGTNLSAHSFIDTDLTKIDFINCKWPKSHGRNILYDEIILFSNEDGKTQEDKKTKGILLRFKQSLRQVLAWFLKYISCDKEQIKKVEILYRQLKGKCKEEHNELEISDWHYGEKEMYRKGTRLRRRFFPISLSNLYWLSSGYGERPARAGIGLLLLILLISVLFGFVGLAPNPALKGELTYKITEIKVFTDIFENLSGLITNVLQYSTFEKDPDFIPKNIYGTSLKIFAKLFIPLQATLFAFSVRNRFKR